MGWVGVWSAFRRGGARRRGLVVKFAMKTKFSTVALLLAESLLLTPADAEATPRYRRRDGWLSCLSAACWTLTLGTFSFYLAGGMDIAAKMPDIGPVDGKLIATGFTTMVSWVMLVGVIVLRWGSDHVARQINRWAKWPRVEPAPFGYYLVDSCAAFCWVGIRNVGGSAIQIVLCFLALSA